MASVRILFITATRIGDAVLSTGMLQHLIDRDPGARITVVAGRLASPLFEEVPGLERLVLVDKMPLSLHWAKLWMALIGHRWDLVVDLRASAISYVLLTRRRVVIGPARPDQHRVEELAQAMGLPNPPAPTVWLAPRHAAAARHLVPGEGLVLALGPAANWIGKEWRAERFAELARRLTETEGLLPGARVAVFAAEHERPRVEHVLHGVKPDRLIDLVGRIDLLTAAACLRRCALFIGNDSGLMHLAAAAGVPTIGLFGPSREGRYAPWGPHCAYVRTAESLEALTSSPDYNPATTGTLMDGLTVDAVVQAATDLWNGLPARTSAAG